MRSPTKNARQGWRYGLRLGMAVTVAACGLLPLPSGPAAAAPPPAPRPPKFPTLAYVAESCSDPYSDGAVARLDTSAGTVAGYIPTGGCPGAIALDPGGAVAYVARVGRKDPDAILVMSTVANRVFDVIEVDHAPGGVAVSPDGAQVYTTIHNDDDLSRRSTKVVVIDTHDDSISATLPIAGNPGAVAVDHGGRRALVGVTRDAKGTYDNLTVIDTRTEQITRTVPLPSSPRAIAVHPSRHRAYVTGTASEKGQVFVINTATGGLLASIPVSEDLPQGLAASGDGTRLYVGTLNDAEGAITVINTVTDAVTGTIPIPGHRLPAAVALSPDGGTAYVTTTTGRQDAVVAVDTAAGAVTATIDIADGLDLNDLQNIAVGRFVGRRHEHRPRKPRHPGKPGRSGKPGRIGPARAVDVLGPPPPPAAR
ncbi:YncE family protein [Nonomuraea sp. SMC257]|uniref:YncE family protein n=1 Tax=Nonomuraea montanisoli TaxID=2741721 RepID=A0A7Y6M1B7_9ACTN|nr:YncE family protein [Nonomuraea montanisoli]NUW31458.1 YncE family protein [Nonomuraea montanisoli]